MPLIHSLFQITAAYNYAKSARLWTLSAYSMSNEQEYWAVSSQVFFNVDHLSYDSGGMSK